VRREDLRDDHRDLSDDIDIYLRYRLKPFKSHKSTPVEQTTIVRWTKDINARSGVVHDIHQGSSQAPDGLPGTTVSTNRMLVPPTRQELVEDSVRVIHNTKSRITDNNIDCYSLRTMIAAKRLNNIRTEMSKTALKISTVEKGSKLSVSQRRSRFIRRAKLRTTLPGTL
jgi:hypothetical protein